MKENDNSSTNRSPDFFSGASRSDPYTKQQEEGIEQPSISGKSAAKPTQGISNNQGMPNNPGTPKLGPKGNNSQMPGKKNGTPGKKDEEPKSTDSKDGEKSPNKDKSKKGSSNGKKPGSNGQQQKKPNPVSKALSKAKKGSNSAKGNSKKLIGENEEEPSDGEKTLSTIADKAKGIGGKALSGFMALPIPFAIKILILAFAALLIFVLFIYVIIFGFADNEVDYASNFLCDTIITVNEKEYTQPEFVMGLINSDKKYYKSTDDYIKAFTIMMNSTIYQDYLEKTKITKEHYYNDFTFLDPTIPETCKFVFCEDTSSEESDNDEATEESDDNETTDKSDESAYEMPTDENFLSGRTPNFFRKKGQEKLVDCLLDLSEIGYTDFNVQVQEGKEVSPLDKTFVETETYALGSTLYTNNTKEEVLERFSYMDAVEEVFNTFIENKEKMTPSIADDMLQLKDSEYKEIINSIESNEMKYEELEQCHFRFYHHTCSIGSLFSCNGTIGTDIGVVRKNNCSEYGDCPFGCCYDSDLYQECVTWVKYRIYVVARDYYGVNSEEYKKAMVFGGPGWGNAGVFRYERVGTSKGIGSDVGYKYVLFDSPTSPSLSSVTIKPGTIIEWKKGDTGHVAFVEAVNGDEITYSDGGRGYGGVGLIHKTTISSGLYYLGYELRAIFYPFDDLCEDNGNSESTDQ